MVLVMSSEECEIEDLKPYKTKNIPAAGAFLKKDDSQMSLI